MLSVFKKIWFFSGRERNNLTKSIVVAFFHAVFNAFQFVAIYYMIKCLFKQNVVQQDIVIALVVLIISLMGKIITQNVSQMNQTHAGYFMAANKRIELGEKIKRVPMGFFNNFSLGKLTILATTNLTHVILGELKTKSGKNLFRKLNEHSKKLQSKQEEIINKHNLLVAEHDELEHLKDNMDKYLGRTKMEDKKESVIGAIKRHQVEDKEKLKEKKEASKEAER